MTVCGLDRSRDKGVCVCAYTHTRTPLPVVSSDHLVDVGGGRVGDLGSGGKARQESPYHLPDPFLPGTATGLSLVPIMGGPGA